MITKETFIELEQKIDVYAQQKQLKTTEAQEYLDQYLQLIVDYFKQINEIEEIDFNTLDSLNVVPMNFQERYEYILARKHHFMGYRQMKTLKTELIKMNAAYQIRQKSSNLK
ncbi:MULTISPECIES: YpoC family protein [Staphylococcus]|uniref:YpoC family protein n=1 Tax=Staphylococcus TaxID=1279 RepID=UPI00124E1FE2|nr:MULTISPECIES: hypothetical protein [Staphylococcus]KAB2480047.1 hypothetical protein F9B39_04115 [Staphylococcus sp. CH99b_3]MCD8838119.1 hypothetical protein [Staphylococcus arlettae]MCD8865708.1 hypothetical protein [Staphylococcus arlettae]MCD9053782.1 hypothetical protein [Staphylococcus arlettae]UXU51402.1 hypothetical protein MUA71_07550 [Staphylococcus arlettae]